MIELKSDNKAEQSSVNILSQFWIGSDNRSGHRFWILKSIYQIYTTSTLYHYSMLDVNLLRRGLVYFSFNSNWISRFGVFWGGIVNYTNEVCCILCSWSNNSWLNCCTLFCNDRVLNFWWSFCCLQDLSWRDWRRILIVSPFLARSCVSTETSILVIYILFVEVWEWMKYLLKFLCVIPANLAVFRLHLRHL